LAQFATLAHGEVVVTGVELILAALAAGAAGAASTAAN
jgi:hypothetical protein